MTGLNAAQAAAQLNKAGLAFGREIVVPIAEGMTPDVISGQSIAAGESVTPGAVVDVEIPRLANIRLVYDDNDLTVINLGEVEIDIKDVAFETVEGSAANFNAARWADELRAKQCVQI